MYSENHVRVEISDSPDGGVPALGMIVLSTDFTCERDFNKLAQANDLVFDMYVNRVHFDNPMTVQSLGEMVNELGSVAADILPDAPLDAIMFNCTSASALLGDVAVENAIAAGKPDTPVLTTAAAAARHIRQAGHRKISVLAPYSLEVSRGLANYFEATGLDIVSLSYLDIADDRDVARLDHQAILDSAAAAVAPDADALFISCTATRAAEILPQIEQRVGIPVFSSNHSTFWQAMQLLKLA